MSQENLKHYVYAIFSDTVMVFLALLVIPILMLMFFPLTRTQSLIITAIDWTIYAAFLLEFALKVYVAEKRAQYIKENPINSTISLIIILSPLAGLFTAYFIGAPLLRLILISRAIRLSGAVEKATFVWSRVTLKTYAIIPLTVGAGFVISFFRPQLQYAEHEIEWLSAFIQVNGTIYAIVAAFVIFQIWGEFNLLDEKIRNETVSLRNIYLLSLQLSHRKVADGLKKDLLDYIDAVIKVHWGKTKAKLGDTKDCFVRLFRSLENLKVKTLKDQVLLDSINEELKTTSEIRTDIISLASTTTPSILWALLLFTSTMMVFGFMIADFQNQLLATFVITTFAAAIALITAIIYDMDYPFENGFWALSPQPYFELEDFVKGTKS